MGRWSYWGYHPSRPKEAKHGIKAKTSRGAFGTTWWAKRWIAVLESFDIGARLGRGRSYARSGQVTEVRIQRGEVHAKVQGSRPRPYDVVIRLQPFSEKERQALGKALGREALFAAKLLAGEMPEGIEDLFAKAGASLFPGKSRDLKTECSCPDWSNPCKHVAAVYYLLAEEFDRDPFLLLQLRGLTREELPALVGSPAPKAEASTRPRRAPAPESPVPAPSAPLPADHGAFWGTPGASAPLALPVSRAAEVPEALLKRLGGFPFWRGERPLEEALALTYRAAAQRGLALLAGENPFTEGAEGTSEPSSRKERQNPEENGEGDPEVRMSAWPIRRSRARGGKR